MAAPRLDPVWDRFMGLPKKGNLKVCVVGAGNLGHVLIGMLGARDEIDISVLSRKASAVGFVQTMMLGVKCRLQSPHSNVPDNFVTGVPTKVTANPAEVIPEADFIFITVPSNARNNVMNQIAPHIDSNRKVFIGVAPGIGGFDWIARNVCKAQNKLKNVVLWGIKDVPFMSAWTVPGKSVTNLGPKKDLYLGMANHSADSQEAKVTQHLLQSLLNINTIILPSFMVITLTPGNPIMHPAIMYGMVGPWSQWDGTPFHEQPLFYEGVSELSAYFLQRADNEVQAIKNKITQLTGQELEAVWPLRINLKKVYGELVGSNRTLMLAMRTNRAYETIRTPLKKVKGGFMPDIDHRFFREDIPFGLVVLRDIAGLVGVETLMIDELLMWAQGLMGKEYLVNGKLVGKDMFETGAPTHFGVKTIYDLVPKVSAPKSAL